MWYWREENFRGLSEIVSRLSNEPDLKGFRDYLSFREEGLRRKAFAALAEFLAMTQSWTVPQRRDFVRWIIETHRQNPRVFDLLPRPLRESLVDPTISQWQSEMPTDPIPFRLCDDYQSLRTAILLDPSHQDTVLRMIMHLWGGVAMACHELPTGVLGTPTEVLADVDEIEGLIVLVDDAGTRDVFSQKVRTARQVVKNYSRYLTARGSAQCFEAWAVSNGLSCRM